MVMSSELSLIPYPVDSYVLRPFTEQALSFRQDNVKGEVQRYELFQRSKFYNDFTHKNRMHATYGTGNQIKATKLDQLGLLVDIYV